MMKNNNQLLDEMVIELKKQSQFYNHGNEGRKYTSDFTQNIIDQIKKNSLNNFRNWHGPAGSSISSYIGMYDDLAPKFGENFHPFNKKFSFFDNNLFVKLYNKIINKLSKHLSFFSYFSFRSSLGRKYYLSKHKIIEKMAYEKIYNLDKELLLSTSDSEIGNPAGFYKNEKFYTLPFFDELIKINFIKENCNFEQINSVVEVGAGIGLGASVFLQAKKTVKYTIVDTPPALYISQNYLEALGYKVLGYKDLVNIQNLKDVDTSKYQVICLPSWKIDLLNNNKFDLFINYHSFQYLPPDIVENYIKKIKPLITKYIYLNNHKDWNRSISNKKNEDSLEIKRDHYLKFINNDFKIKVERNGEEWTGTKKEYFEILFAKNTS